MPSPTELVAGVIRFVGEILGASSLRFETGSLTSAKVLRELEKWDVKAVVVGRAFTGQPALLRGLARRYPRTLRVGDLKIYLRS